MEHTNMQIMVSSCQYKTRIILFTILVMLIGYKSACQEMILNTLTRPTKSACSMTLKPEEREKYLQSIQGEKNFDRNRMTGTYNIPVQFHLLRRTNGTGGITAAEAATELAEANNEYSSFGVEFFQCSPVHFIDNDDFFNTTFDHDWDNFCGQTTAEYLIAGQNNVANVVNLYYVNTDGWNWGSFPSFLQDYCKDWIILDIDDIGSSTLLAHELGHYFNLLHTFQGYGNGVADDEEHITRNAGNGCYNCYGAGDFLCDTPADNNHWNNSCEWDGIGTDICSNLDFDPDPANIMSYSDCPDIFTEGQKTRILLCIVTSRAYLHCPFLSDCQSNWNLSSTQNGTYAFQASNVITSTSDINPGALSVYDAENSVTLLPGFHAKSGSTFTAFLDGCWGPLIFP